MIAFCTKKLTFNYIFFSESNLLLLQKFKNKLKNAFSIKFIRSVREKSFI